MEIHGLLIKAISIHASHANNNNHSAQAHFNSRQQVQQTCRKRGRAARAHPPADTMSQRVQCPGPSGPPESRAQAEFQPGGISYLLESSGRELQHHQQNIKQNADDWVSPSGDCHLIINNNQLWINNYIVI